MLVRTYQNINSNKNCLLTYIDLKKAFDTVHHDNLLEKLKTNYFLSPSALSLFKNYLSNRSQKVFINNTLSDSTPMITGVPQGSCLGPLLFLTYINDLPSVINNSAILLFADDTVLYHFSDTFSLSYAEMQSDLNVMNLWCKDNLLQVNVKKTKSMFINHKTHCKPISSSLKKLQLNNECIDFVDDYKYLGIWINSQLSFSKHVNTIISKVSFRLKKLSRIRNCLSKQTSLLLYKCMILPLFDYGDIFFCHSANKVLLNKLQTLQNSAVRIICKLEKRSNTESDEKNLGLLRLEKRRLLHCIQIGATFTQDANYIDIHPTRNMRTRAISDNRRQLTLFNPKKTLCERSFCYQIRNIWNSLPTEFHTAADRAALNRLFFLRVNSL